MNKLTIPNGGMPFEGDDLLYMQESLRSGFQFILKAISPSSSLFILQGVTLTPSGGDTIISPGIVVINYEMLEFAGATIPTANLANKAIALDVTYDPAGSEVFADLVSRDTYEMRKAVIVDAAGTPDQISFSDTQALVRLGTHVGNLPGLFQEINIPLPDFITGSLKAYKFGQLVILHGQFSNPNGFQAGTFPIVLESVLRPLHQSSFALGMTLFDSGMDLNFVPMLYILTNGNFGIVSQSNSVWISGVTYIAQI